MTAATRPNVLRDDVRGVRGPRRARTLAGAVGPLLLQLLGFGLAIGVWQVVAVYKGITVPTPGQVVQDLRDNFLASEYLQAHQLGGGKGYWYDLYYTSKNVLIGVTLGSAIGVALGLISVPFRIFAQVLNPIAATFGAAPIFVAAPFFLVWFGVVLDRAGVDGDLLHLAAPLHLQPPSRRERSTRVRGVGGDARRRTLRQSFARSTCRAPCPSCRRLPHRSGRGLGARGDRRAARRAERRSASSSTTTRRSSASWGW